MDSETAQVITLLAEFRRTHVGDATDSVTMLLRRVIDTHILYVRTPSETRRRAVRRALTRLLPVIDTDPRAQRMYDLVNQLAVSSFRALYTRALASCISVRRARPPP
jgi:hypothetical protein